MWNEWRHDAQARAGAVVGVAADERGVDPEQLAADVLAADEEIRLLAGLAIAAAMRTVNEDKIRALGRALAHGLDDDARVDEELLIVKALEDLERPHITVLDLMATRMPWTFGDAPALDPRQSPVEWQVASIERQLPGTQAVLPTVLGALDRHGLIDTRVDLQPAFRAFSRSATSGMAPSPSVGDMRPPEQFVVTDLGLQLLEHLRKAATEALDEPQPRPSED